MIDPDTLELLATYDMPNAPDPPGTRAYQNFAGGGYFFLDDSDRIWSSTKTSHLFVLKVSRDGRSITKLRDYDLSGVLASDERISSALPDFRGRIWFVSKKNGKVGILNPRTRRVRVLRLGEDIQNSFTIDRGAVYVVSSRRMYRFSVRNGRPRVDWKVRYRNSGIVKPGQADAGSGTTPTIMSGGYVAITDNADPMNVVVYRKAKRLRGKAAGGLRGAGVRAWCERHGELADHRRPLALRGEQLRLPGPVRAESGALTTPGLARVDVNRRGTGCRVVWTNRTERVPTVVSKLSARTGLIYTYTRDEAPAGQQPYFWTAISARSGKTVYKVYAGSGPASTTTTPVWRSAPTARPTWA